MLEKIGLAIQNQVLFYLQYLLNYLTFIIWMWIEITGKNKLGLLICNRYVCSTMRVIFFVGPASARSYKIGVIGNNCLVGWLVANAVFSETAQRTFLKFCMKLGDYKGRKVTELDFWNEFLIWRYSRTGIRVSPKSDTLIFSSETALTIFLVFGLKLVLNMTFNLNENYFSEKFAIRRYLTSKSSKIAQIEIFGHFLDFASLVFLGFAHNDRWAWCLVVFLQFAGPVNIFLFFDDFEDTKHKFIL